MPPSLLGLSAFTHPTSHSLPGFASPSPVSNPPTPSVLGPGLHTVFVPLGHVLTIIWRLLSIVVKRLNSGATWGSIPTQQLLSRMTLDEWLHLSAFQSLICYCDE